MNYFDLYELPVQLSVNQQMLKKKYLELSRRYHPDYFTQQSEAAQQEALEKSAMVNKAFKTFRNEDETIKYVLELKGMLQENEKYDLPPDFLMDMMELNEHLLEIQFDPESREKASEKIKQLEAALYEPVKPVLATNLNDTNDNELLVVKDYYFKKKYIARLKQQLGEKL